MNLRDWGQTFDETTLKKGLKELNSYIYFDVATKHHHVTHPFIATRQGVFHKQKHVCAMERGIIPEFNIWGVVDGKKSHIVKVGWRHTFATMVARGVPHITWDNLCKKFNIERKNFVGDPATLHIAACGSLRPM